MNTKQGISEKYKEVSEYHAGLLFQGVPVKPGLILVQPRRGLVFVGGMESKKVEYFGTEERVTTVDLFAVDATQETKTCTPFDRLEKNGVRLPANTEIAAKALKTLARSIGPKDRLWKNRMKDYQESVDSGDVVGLSQTLATIFGSKRGRDYSMMSLDVTYDERRLGEKIIKLVADEPGLSIDFKDKDPEDVIKQILSAPEQKAKALAAQMAAQKKQSSRYIAEDEFKRLAQRNPEDVQAEINKIYGAVGTDRNTYKTTAKVVVSHPKFSERKIREDNRHFYEQNLARVPEDPIKQRLFKLAASCLNNDQFRLFTTVNCFANKAHILDAAKETGVCASDMLVLYNTSVEVLRPHLVGSRALKEAKLPDYLRSIHKIPQPKRRKTPC